MGSWLNLLDFRFNSDRAGYGNKVTAEVKAAIPGNKSARYRFTLTTFFWKDLIGKVK